MTTACNLYAASDWMIVRKETLVHSSTLVNGMPQIHTDICKRQASSLQKLSYNQHNTHAL
jgi:peroxiredoxin